MKSANGSSGDVNEINNPLERLKTQFTLWEPDPIGGNKAPASLNLVSNRFNDGGGGATCYPSLR